MSYTPLPSWIRKFTILFAIAGFVVAIGVTVRTPQRLTDFAGYYLASTIVQKGDSIPSLYNDQWFAGKMRQVSPQDSSIVFYVNPPAVSFVMLPLTWADPSTAKILWNIFTLVLMLLIWKMCIPLFHIPKDSGYQSLLFCILFASVPLLRNLQRGQLYVLMLFLVLMMWKGYTEKKSLLTGGSLAVLLLLKYFGWMFLILFIVQRRWKDVLTTLGCTLIGMTITIMIVGTETIVQHIHRLLASFGTMDVMISGLPCIPAFIGGLFVAHPVFNPHALFNLPWLAPVLIFILAVFMIGFTIRKNSIEQHTNRSFWAVLVLSVLFTPLAAHHHYVLLALPLFFFLANTSWDSLNIWNMVKIGCIVYFILGWLPTRPGIPEDIIFRMGPIAQLVGTILLWSSIAQPSKEQTANIGEDYFKR